MTASDDDSTQDEPHEARGAPAGAEGASVFGHRRPAGVDVLGPAELSDQGARMDLVERTADITPPPPVTKPGRREQASRRLASRKASRRERAG